MQGRLYVMQKIMPSLWFDDQAEAAAAFYTSIFNDSTLGSISRYDAASAEASGQPEGSVLTVEFELEGQQFLALNGGPQFTPNPSISFIIRRSTKEDIDALWEKLSEDGEVLMPLDSYPFSDWYGWIQDKYGISWQLILPQEDSGRRPSLVSLLFVGEQYGNAEAAIEYYVSIFDGSEKGVVARYGPDQEPNTEGSIMYADYRIAGQWFAAMDSALPHDFGLNEAISLMVICMDQDEEDYYWNTLTADGGEEGQCGWLTDKYGVSWQIVPKQLTELLTAEDKEKAGRAMEAMLEMKKIDIATLQDAFERG